MNQPFNTSISISRYAGEPNSSIIHEIVDLGHGDERENNSWLALPGRQPDLQNAFTCRYKKDSGPGASAPRHDRDPADPGFKAKNPNVLATKAQTLKV